MPNTNMKLPEIIAIPAVLAPLSQAAATVNTGWISMAQFYALSFLLQTGVLGASATVDAKIQQATDNAGTGAKDVTGKAITQIVKATGDNKQAWVNVRGSDLDTTGGFGWVTLSITVGTAASLIAVAAFGVSKYQAASVLNPAAVVQNVG
jgi:hypothetical protein